ncbi:hypothetical protein SKAU_G00034640 [Synaphobranchus kaupii]|uniref:Fibroblast growth factor-binding protein 2 n=1 Tax=Synaphobranchus kaupii TaxID=118154 RepID=A0A9Q1GFR4_SYNKA|nr:hypothetical protein SKAU_G00034640 [Synaphobranchus kaupii]
MKAQACALLLIACCLWMADGQGEPPKKSIWEDPIQFNTKAKDTCTMIVTGQGELTKLRVSCKNQDKAYWCEYTGKPQVCRSYNNNPRHYFTQIMWDLRKLPNACQGARVIKPQMCKRASEEAQMVFQTSWPRLFTPRPMRPTQERPPAQAKPEQPKLDAPKPEVQRPEEARPEEARPEAPRPDVPKPEAPRPEPARPEAPKQEVPKAEVPKSEASRPVAPRPEVPKPESPRQAKPSQPKQQPAKPEPSKPLIKIIPVKKVPAKPTKPTPSRSAQPPTKASAKKMAQEYCWRSLQGICSYVIGWFHN